MQTVSENNRKIIKNTVYLYFRMLLLLAINLYASRVVLNTLGVSDYGTYNVVGGLVAMFSIFSNSLSTAISRFLTFELGKGDNERLKDVFCTSMNVLVILAVSVGVVAELVGVWFLNNYMNIPHGRMQSANWVFQCSILTFMVNLISLPYNASMISHEKMNVFAYISILEAVLKLAVVYALFVSPFDKLKTYALLIFSVSLLIRGIYGVYCKRNFPECVYRFLYDKKLLKKIFSFAGWNFLGSGAGLLNTQGVNVVINIFFGVTINAARGIANQVESVVQQFVNSFLIALNPQITKQYATGNTDYLHSLVIKSAKFSCYLMLFFAIPVCLETHIILRLWLGFVPEYTVTFIRWTFVSQMCIIIGNSLVTAMLATGNIKQYQIVITIFGILNFPLTLLAFELGYSVVSAYVIYTIVYFTLIFVRIYLVKDLIKMSMVSYLKDAVLKVMFVSVVAMILPSAIYFTQEESLLRLVEIVIVGSISTALSVGYIGMARSEREKFLTLVLSKIRK